MNGQTVRLLNAVMFGLVGLEILESLRLTASDVLDTKSWGEGGGIFLRDIEWESELYRVGLGKSVTARHRTCPRPTARNADILPNGLKT
jgi:hypothetical protein